MSRSTIRLPTATGPRTPVTDTTENAAITHHMIELGGTQINYTAKVGHLVTVDPQQFQTQRENLLCVRSSRTQQTRRRARSPSSTTAGPGSSSVYVLLGSFAPMRLKTSLPDFTPPAPYQIETNPDSLLDHSDLVFINPVGTGYSAAIAPNVNKDFWGTDQDAASLKQFVKRYLTVNDRWNSPKFLFGESYGTARTAVLSYMLHEDGIDLNGLTIQSSILDYSQAGNPVGLLPTCAADAWYHGKVTLTPPPRDLPSYAEDMMRFASKDYAAALQQMPQPDPDTLRQLSQRIGIDSDTLLTWNLNVAAQNDIGTSLFLVTLLKDQGLALGSYDGRATGVGTGIAARIDPKSGGNDPTMTAVNGAYTVMWNTYLNEDLRFTSSSSFTDLNDQAFANWDFHHIDPTGAQKGIDDKGNVILYTAGDLAATMSLNVDLKVLSANGYYDFVTPFYQTIARSAGDAAGEPDDPAKPDGQVLPVRPHDLPGQRFAHSAQGRPRAHVREHHRQPCRGGAHPIVAADDPGPYRVPHRNLNHIPQEGPGEEPIAMVTHHLQKLARSFRLECTGKRIGDVPAETPVHLTIVLKPHSPVDMTHPVMSRADYGKRHGTSQAVIDRLIQYAEGHGLKVEHADPATHMVRLSGTYAQANSAFEPEGSGLYDMDGQKIIAREGHLAVPAGSRRTRRRGHGPGSTAGRAAAFPHPSARRGHPGFLRPVRGRSPL